MDSSSRAVASFLLGLPVGAVLLALLGPALLAVGLGIVVTVAGLDRLSLADRERQRETDGSLTACPNCGALEPPERDQCGMCGADL